MTSPLVIHHDPAGGTSGKVSGIIPAAGHRPMVTDGIGEVWATPQRPGFCSAAIARSPDEASGLAANGAADDPLHAAMAERPILVSRPVVCMPKAVRLCRSSESAFDLPGRLPPGPLAREDGQLIIDSGGNRLV